MEIIIAHGTKKRKIVGAFQICGNRKDLEDLANLIRHKLEDDPACSGGWLDINNVQPPVGGPPQKWEE